ncbi:thioredoxin family protein [Aquimarina algicola]|uniref:Thioredoxin family protein n=1 Tax=Aquimarina algicola TaxID=2589995 RepID=A0A504JEU1_9FLAO|nr:thioredoxin family protein [Aquimarina algicola]TPN85369.1 thioredoxin family protein [Aquimarina algicola]
MRTIILILSFSFFGIYFLSAQEWLTDFEKAKQIATNKNHSILLVFSGSDWCAPCIKLEKQVLETSEFKKDAHENYVLVRADFPRKKKNQLSQKLQAQNKKLAETYNRSGGFPLVVVIDQFGKKLGEVGYIKSSPKEYLEMLDNMIK